MSPTRRRLHAPRASGPPLGLVLVVAGVMLAFCLPGLPLLLWPATIVAVLAGAAAVNNRGRRLF